MAELEFRPPLLIETASWQRVELLDMPEWDMQVEVRSMTAGDRLNYLTSTILFEKQYGDQATDWGAILPASVIPCVWAPAYRNGRWIPGLSQLRIFHWSDYDALQNRGASALYRIHEVAMRLSGFGNDELKASYMRLVSDGDFRLLFELAKELGMTLSEIAEKMPAWELSWWRSYFTLRNYEHEQSMKKGSGSNVTEFGGFQ